MLDSAGWHVQIATWVTKDALRSITVEIEGVGGASEFDLQCLAALELNADTKAMALLLNEGE